MCCLCYCCLTHGAMCAARDDCFQLVLCECVVVFGIVFGFVFVCVLCYYSPDKIIGLFYKRAL